MRWYWYSRRQRRGRGRWRRQWMFGRLQRWLRRGLLKQGKSNGSNMLEMFEPGQHSTYVVEAVVDSPEQVKLLETLCDARQMTIEDWADNIQSPCKACSEGRPHEQHDHRPVSKGWQRERRIAVATRDGNDLESVLDAWTGEVRDWGIALER